MLYPERTIVLRLRRGRLGYFFFSSFLVPVSYVFFSVMLVSFLFWKKLHMFVLHGQIHRSLGIQGPGIMTGGWQNWRWGEGKLSPMVVNAICFFFSFCFPCYTSFAFYFFAFCVIGTFGDI